MIEHDVFAYVIDVLEKLKIPYMIGVQVIWQQIKKACQ